MLNALRRSKDRKHTAACLNQALVARAREPVFFLTLGVQDTLDGRFDLVALHAWLVLSRLTAAGATALSQAFVDTVFITFDEALRELGAGDIGIGKRLKKLAKAFYGRMRAYGEAKDEAAMEAALIRNLYRGANEPSAKVLARYVLRAKAHLAASDLENGELDFGPLPDEE
ncbi:MAG: ubiquinol-cytochrome C chaperone [Alphaproteobacteria bacterium]|nr:ubiquinol-cytochrome C chaperone [Alphaproteobacteria bacterium]MDE2110567.1 ubiquinol-cytochrome C chaperone [Alphaproteobacteria bacterium]MDE2492705.1 ubiquinol-cytochrome C chaperone [Alphaproteobacteria bacterium]